MAPRSHTLPMDATATPRHQGWKERVDWSLVKNILTIASILLVVVLLYSYADKVEWAEVWKSLRGYTALRIVEAFAVTVMSFAIYSCFDLFGRHLLDHGLGVRRVMGIASISYAFNLALGTIIGAAGIRLRLYQQAGLNAGQIARVIGISVVTNWLGYSLVAGMLFITGAVKLPPQLGTDISLDAFGIVLLAIVASYLFAVTRWGGHTLRWRSHELTLPRAPVGFMQVAVAAANWMSIGAVLWLLLDFRVAYPLVLSAVLVGSMAGLIVRVPGGLGVLEAVATAMLSRYLPVSEVLAGVLAFRAVYYLTPLFLATLAIAVLEYAGRRKGAAKKE